MKPYDDLADLLEETAARAEAWTDGDRWNPEPGSPGAEELANKELRQDGNPWGERPVRTVYQYGHMALMYAVEMALCMAPLVRTPRPAPGIESLTRTSLEAASIVWWLFEPGLDARKRVCRMMLLRRKSALELEKAAKAIDVDPATTGNESVASVEAYRQDLGLQPFDDSNWRKVKLEGEVQLGYTDRVEAFGKGMGMKGAYNIYSGVAHAELAGLWRLFQQTGTKPDTNDPIHKPGPDPRATAAAVNAALTSIIGSLWRVSELFGWSVLGRRQEFEDWLRHVDAETARLTP